MFRKALRRGEELLERGSLVHLAFAAILIAAAASQVLIKKRSYVEIFKWIGRFSSGNFFCFGFQESFGAVIFGDYGVIR